MHSGNGRIVLSPKYGVNPSVNHCYWCGGDTDVVMFGLLKGDIEAPRSVCLSYDPCPACRSKFEHGILWVEAAREPTAPNQKKMGEGYPTGDYVLMTVAATQRILGSVPAVLEQVLAKKTCCVEPAVFRSMFKDVPGDQDKPSTEKAVEIVEALPE